MASAASATPLDGVSGVVVGGAKVASGQEPWTLGGLDKVAAYDRGRLDGQVIVAWRGALSSRLGALVSVDLQSNVGPEANLDEAYLTLRPAPGARLRLSGRAGLFFPPVSLEHDGAEWALARTLTPSALNTWIAEEVKVAGVELSVRGALAGLPVGVTGAMFQGNDPSGALLAFRGWALHDRRAGLATRLALPPSPGLFAGKQSPRTRPVDEVDGRWGGYGRVEVQLSPRATVSLFAYDNNGDETTVTHGQYAWRTRFAQAALRWTPSARTEVLAQGLIGETAMGAPLDGMTPADVGFAAGYVLVTCEGRAGATSVRLEQFSVSDRTFKALDDNAEHGWAATLAWTRPLRPNLDWVVEGVRTDSRRPDRLRFGQAPKQADLQGRSAVRWSF